MQGADGAPAALDVPPAVGVVPAAARPGCAAVRGDCALEAFLQRVAPGGEVLVAISNFHLIQHGGMLNTWIENVQRSKTGPWMVLAIDSDLHEHLDQRGIPNYYIKQEIAAVQQGTGNNHAVSALKFGVLAEFLKLGWAVLLSDVDVVTLSDPFAHLYRDRDVEGAPPPPPPLRARRRCRALARRRRRAYQRSAYALHVPPCLCRSLTLSL